MSATNQEAAELSTYTASGALLPPRMRDATVTVIIGLLLTAMLPTPIGAQDRSNGARLNGVADAQFTAGGTASCMRCHAGERMTLMAETAHGNTDNPHTPYAQQGCESCHGPGSLHVSRARGGRGFPALIRFDSKESVPQQTAACLNCHGKEMGELEGMAWTDSLHDSGTMTCVTCHEAHIVGNSLRDQEQQRKSCAKCHDVQITNHRRFENVGIVFDKLSCYDCHDVHQLERTP